MAQARLERINLMQSPSPVAFNQINKKNSMDNNQISQSEQYSQIQHFHPSPITPPLTQLHDSPQFHHETTQYLSDNSPQFNTENPIIPENFTIVNEREYEAAVFRSQTPIYHHDTPRFQPDFRSYSPANSDIQHHHQQQHQQQHQQNSLFNSTPSSILNTSNNNNSSNNISNNFRSDNNISPINSPIKKVKKSPPLQTSDPNRSRNYECDGCSKKFFRTQDLKRHKVTHNKDIRPFACTSCTSTFTRADALQRHIKKSRCRINSQHRSAKAVQQQQLQPSPQSQQLQLQQELPHQQDRYNQSFHSQASMQQQQQPMAQQEFINLKADYSSLQQSQSSTSQNNNEHHSYRPSIVQQNDQIYHPISQQDSNVMSLNNIQNILG
ncbi:hypothetical protein HK099_001157 [Clydaea vesicula]|uniref:C2H2-type domain-containing protein n=1 Tax=Clydaea vesicula TaxID=447962 RepID=A0AAD5U3Q6_9FUNG|nr:hypothetical protein HK099_001157 [Clydaea vesicula]